MVTRQHRCGGRVALVVGVRPGFDELPAVSVCLGCLIDDGDAQLARGLELARRMGQVDWDTAIGEWFVPPDAQAGEK